MQEAVAGAVVECAIEVAAAVTSPRSEGHRTEAGTRGAVDARIEGAPCARESSGANGLPAPRALW